MSFSLRNTLGRLGSSALACQTSQRFFLLMEWKTKRVCVRSKRPHEATEINKLLRVEENKYLYVCQNVKEGESLALIKSV